jgi:hypothetical protein
MPFLCQPCISVNKNNKNCKIPKLRNIYIILIRLKDMKSLLKKSGNARKDERKE